MGRRDKTKFDIRGTSRRDFIKYSVALGAFFGVERWRTFELLGDLGGNALADAAACAVTNRSVHIFGGSAGFAWFQLLWPQTWVVENFRAPYALHVDPKTCTLAPGFGAKDANRLWLTPEAPWKNLPANRGVSAFMGGANEFGGVHFDDPVNSSLIDTGKNLFSACAALQQATPTLVPVISIDLPKTQMPYDVTVRAAAVAGAPGAVHVQSATAMATLFDSAASNAMGPLANPATAATFEAYYKAFVGLQATATRPTYARGYSVGKTAARIIGVNLASQLKPTNDDYTRYGVSPLTSESKLVEFATALIITAKAFKLGLTSCVLMPAFNDDAHDAFTNMAKLKTTVKSIGASLDAFLGDLNAPDASCAGTTIADNTIITFHCDTPKTPFDTTKWPDATPGNSNWVYALGAGWLKPGWFGGIENPNGAQFTIKTFDPATGAPKVGPTTDVTLPMGGAIAYAVAKGDMRRVSDFYRAKADFSGIVTQKIV